MEQGTIVQNHMNTDFLTYKTINGTPSYLPDRTSHVRPIAQETTNVQLSSNKMIP